MSNMSNICSEKIANAIWVAESLFSRGKVSGSAANLSFRHENTIYISAGGSCFGRLSEDSFAVLDMEGKHLGGPAPSKEFPLHHMLYLHDKCTQAVLHTHSTYATLWSCLVPGSDIIPSHTPYLKMRVGEITYVPYAKPGSQELFHAFEENLGASRAYLLANHGPVVAASNIIDAFYDMEEIEEAACNAWLLRDSNINKIY